MKYALTSVLFFSVLVAGTLGFAGARGGRADETIDNQPAFAMSAELNHGGKFLEVAFEGGSPWAPAALQIAVTVSNGGVPTTYTSVEYFLLDALGEEYFYLPLGFDTTVTNFEMLLTSCQLAPGGQVQAAVKGWRVGSKLLGDFSDLQNVHPLAFESFVDPDADAETDMPAPGEGVVAPKLPGVSGSYAFTSQLLDADGHFVLSGSGNYMAAAPVDSFRLVSGPAGIFTAN